MMFLLRAAFWIGLVLVLLPTGSKTSSESAPKVAPAEAASAATATVADLSQFCDRQPRPCEVGSQIARTIGRRAEAGAKMVLGFLTQRHDSQPSDSLAKRNNGSDATGSIGGSDWPLPRPRPNGSQDTLTATDRAPAWRTPRPHQEAALP